MKKKSLIFKLYFHKMSLILTLNLKFVSEIIWWAKLTSVFQKTRSREDEEERRSKKKLRWICLYKSRRRTSDDVPHDYNFSNALTSSIVLDVYNFSNL